MQARAVRLADERETFERELGGVGEADSPAAYPTAKRVLSTVKEVYREFDRASIAKGQSSAFVG